ASGPVGLVSDPDEGAEPTSVAKGQAGQIEQQQPGMAGDGAAPRGQAVGGGQIQFLWCPQDRDRGTRTCRRLGCALSHDHAPVAIAFWSPPSGSMRAGSHGTALSPQPGTTVPPARL